MSPNREEARMFDVVCSDVWGALLAWSDNRREKMMKKVICFDLWGTLLYSRSCKASGYEDVFIRLGVPKKDIYPFVRQLMAGTMYNYKQIVHCLFKHFGLEDNHGAMQEALRLWQEENRDIAWLNGAQESLERIRDECTQLVLITNITTPTWHTVLEMFGLKDIFDHTFASCEWGLAKPNPMVWQIVKSWYPDISEFWMIGDTPEDDITVPRSMGWKTILVGENGIPITEVHNILEVK